MALSLGLGLSLSNASNAKEIGRTSPQQTLCEAIDKRQYVIVTIGSRRHLLQPYLVTKYDGVTTLAATAVVSDGRQRRGFGIRLFEIDKIKRVEPILATFIPVAGFKPTGDIICSINLIEGVDDASQALLGAS